MVDKQTSLHIAVCLWLVPLIHQMIQILSNLTCGTYHTWPPPRHIAAKLKAWLKSLQGAGHKERKSTRKIAPVTLHLAAGFGRPESVKCLVKRGANPGIKNNDRMTVLELAERLERRGILHILKQAAPGKVDVRYDIRLGDFSIWV